jgi:hypothetical protein
MSANSLGLAIEGLVAVLLVMTIGYCWVLNSRLTRLRADEKALKTTIVELFHATEVAERAIGGLKDMATECDRTLVQRIAAANQASSEIAAQIRAGEMVLNRIALITEAARRQPALAQDPLPREPVRASPAHAPVAFAMHDPLEMPPSFLHDNRASTARSAAAMAEALVQRARLRSRGEAA